MDAIQILIYVAVAILYLILKGVNKATKTDNSLPTEESNGNPAIPYEPTNLPPRKTGPLTFEDLLDEFGEVGRKAKKQINRKSKEAAKIKKKAEETSDQTRYGTSQRKRQTEGEARKQKEKVTINQPAYQSPFSYEKTPSYEQNLEQEYVPVYENTANQVDYDIPEKATYAGLDDRKKRFTPFDLPDKKSSSIYAQLLKDTQGARTAFILSEIFKRKY